MFHSNAFSIIKKNNNPAAFFFFLMAHPIVVDALPKKPLMIQCQFLSSTIFVANTSRPNIFGFEKMASCVVMFLPDCAPSAMKPKT